jgi:hypothetical protein
MSHTRTSGSFSFVFGRHVIQQQQNAQQMGKNLKEEKNLRQREGGFLGLGLNCYYFAPANLARALNWWC